MFDIVVLRHLKGCTPAFERISSLRMSLSLVHKFQTSVEEKSMPSPYGELPIVQARVPYMLTRCFERSWDAEPQTLSLESSTKFLRVSVQKPFSLYLPVLRPAVDPYRLEHGRRMITLCCFDWFGVGALSY